MAIARFCVPIDAAWEALADPLAYPRLFPRWLARVVRLGPGVYVGAGPAGERFAIRPTICRASGVIDVEIVAPGREVEVTRSRLFPLEQGCLYVWVVARRPGEDEAAWAARRRATDVEVARARREVEQWFGRRAA